MNSTRLKFELIDPQTSERMASPLAQLSARLRREESGPPARPQPTRPRALQDLAQGLDFLIAQLGTAETDRDRALAEAERWKTETARMRAEISELQRDVQEAQSGSASLRTTRQTLEEVVAEQQKALLLSMELMQRLEREIDELRDRVQAVESAPPVTANPDPEVLRENQELRAANEALETETLILKRTASDQQKELESLHTTCEALEQELAQLRTAFESELQNSAQKLAASETAATESNKQAELAHRQELAAFQEKLNSALEENARLRAELAEQAKLGDPTAAIRALEQQRDAARAEAASARADVSIQSAEIETKDALISALERALEQQHGSLRSLEQRFAEYATKLQELRLDRLKMPQQASAGQTESAAGFGLMRLVNGFKNTFSPAKAPIEPTEESGQ